MNTPEPNSAIGKDVPEASPGVTTGVKLRWYDLHFVGTDAYLEQAFQSDHVRAALTQVRIASVLGVLLFGGFGVLDALMAEQVKEIFWLIRFVLVCPLWALTYWLSYTHWFIRHMQVWMAFIVMTAGFGISVMIAIAPEPANQSYYAGNILVIVFGYTFSRMTFFWSGITGWSVFLSYQVAAIAFVDTPALVLIANNFFFLSANIIGMFAAYSIERFARRDFYLVNALSEERAAVKHANDVLESRVEERTVEALSAVRAKSEFLANMSHEIRTPMNGVLGMLDLLRGSSLDAVQREQAETAFQSAQGLLTILNDVLDLSKIEAGKMPLHLESVVPGQIVEDVCAILYPQAMGKGLELVPLLSSAAFDHYSLDYTRIRQILLNLVGNALKFTDQGHVSVRCDYVDEFLVIEVRDTGVGIVPDRQAQLFDAFSQADTSTTRKYGGTGLGLTITKELVELMEGTIDLSSELARGSSFCVKLPAILTEQQHLQQFPSLKVAVEIESSLKEAAVLLMLETLGCHVVPKHGTDCDILLVQKTVADSIASRDFRSTDKVLETRLPPIVRLSQLADLLSPVAESSTRVALQEPPRQLCGRVLLVEDNLVNRRVAGAMLKRLAIDYSEASDGAQAVDMIAEENFDLVLMDCQMPVMDGYQATSLIRQRETDGTKRTTIIALTANAMQGDKESCLAAGMDDYLAKPLQFSTLDQVLSRWLVNQ